MKVKHIIACTQWQPSPRYGADRPKVSVLLPTFRRGASGLFLRAARSVLGQTLSELELIIIDDASTDGTADQIRQLMDEDDRVSCLRHPQNVGLPAISEYEGYLKARAAHLAFAFDDDEFEPDALENLLAAAQQQDAAMVYGYVDMLLPDPVTGKHVAFALGRGACYQSLLRGTNFVSNNAVLLHRRVVQDIGFYDPHVAMSRLCDWDLWRRVAECYPLTALPIKVGTVSGPATSDSLGHTHSLDLWLTHEWANLPRNQRLRPGAIEEYDVLAATDALSRESRLALEEIGGTFSDKFWYGKESRSLFVVPPLGGIDVNSRLKAELRTVGHLLVAAGCHDASTTLCFDHLPQSVRQRMRIAYIGIHPPEEMIGANAVILVRDLFGGEAWIDCAQRLKVPCYYFLDDNHMVLSGEYPELQEYTDDEVRRRLQPMAGVLLSSRALVDYFREKNLHANLIYFPPIARRPEWHDRPPAGPKRAGTLRIGFFGGPHRVRAFRKQVLPAIAEIAARRPAGCPVELFVAGHEEGTLRAAENLRIVYFPFELSYDLALARLAACGIDILVHPSGNSRNNVYKTHNVLINAWAMGAVPIVSDAPPYDVLRGEGAAMLCRPEQQAWREAIEHVIPHAEREAYMERLDSYCTRQYGGETNGEAILAILKAHPTPGLTLRDMRWRQVNDLLRRKANVEKPAPLWRRALGKAKRTAAKVSPRKAWRRAAGLAGLLLGRDMRNRLSAAFRPLLEDPAAVEPPRQGCRLRCSRNLQEIECLGYPLKVDVRDLDAILLATVPATKEAGGWIAVEIGGPHGKPLARSVVSLREIDPAAPTLFEFPPIMNPPREELWLRVYGQDLTAPVRILHWRKPGLSAASRNTVRPFCAFRFNS